jgi:hypothetical protein
MSRYNISHPTKPYVSISYGFDASALEYFFMVLDVDPALPEEERGEAGKVIAGHLVDSCSASNVVKQLTGEFKVPLDHPHVIALSEGLQF